MERSLHFLMMISAYKDVTFSATLDINPYHQQMTEQNAEFGQGILTPWVLKTYTKYKVTLAFHSDVLLFPGRQTMQGWQKEILLNKFCIKLFIAFNNLLLCFIFKRRCADGCIAKCTCRATT